MKLMALRDEVQVGSKDPSGFGVHRKRFVYFALIGLFVVQSGLTYTTSTEVPDSAATLSEQARHGEALYREFNCTACHQFYGLGGYMGPDLTNVISAEGKGPAYAKVFILYGTGRMPAMGVSEEQADALVAFLGAVSATGTYPVRNMDLTVWGTYREMHTDEK
ncbi:MAG: cytochrome c [Flavobacteriales bacterium]|nr:cytochrome c [Flavobacteriales bacterium]MCB0758570.1 cytochrome c [Flavobacteriales bacterium]